MIHSFDLTNDEYAFLEEEMQMILEDYEQEVQEIRNDLLDGKLNETEASELLEAHEIRLGLAKKILGRR